MEAPEDQKDSNLEFAPIKIDTSRVDELLLKMDSAGLEDRLHSDFYDNLIKFGVDKKYVDAMRDDFAFEKLDLVAPMKSFEDEEQDQLAADRFVKMIEIEELQMQLEEDEELSLAERESIAIKLKRLQKEAEELELSLSFGMATIADTFEQQKKVSVAKAKAKKDD